MPVEKMLVSLKPVNFFTRNPAIDVAISDQRDNKSVLLGVEETKKCDSGCGEKWSNLGYKSDVAACV